MYNFFIGLMLLSFSVQAQGPVTADKKILCHTTKLAIEALANNEYKEMPIWSGNDGAVRYAILANEKTNTWTIIQYNNDVICIIGTGTNHKIVPRPARM